LILAALLAFAYAAYGSVIGYGQVVQPASYLAYRLQVLRAMEVFVVSHEFAHLVVEEQLPKFQGVLDTETSRDLEYFSDRLALQISRHYGNHEDNFLAFTGIGAILFFRACKCLSLHERSLQPFKNHLFQPNLDRRPQHKTIPVTQRSRPELVGSNRSLFH
jgi:hypothetical protein